MKLNKRAACLSLVMTGVLSACGGGGSSTPAATPVAGPGSAAEGFYEANGGGFSLLFLDDGSYWAFSKFGVMRGTGTSINGSFSSSNARDFTATPPTEAPLTATFTAAPAISSGRLTFGGQIVNYTATPQVDYIYNKAALLSAVAGNWTTNNFDSDGNPRASAPIIISGAGAWISSDASGCQLSWQLTPRASGKNVYSLLATAGAAPCTSPGATLGGVLVVDTPSKNLIILLVTNDNSAAGLFAGAR